MANGIPPTSSNFPLSMELFVAVVKDLPITDLARSCLVCTTWKAWIDSLDLRHRVVTLLTTEGVDKKGSLIHMINWAATRNLPLAILLAQTLPNLDELLERLPNYLQSLAQVRPTLALQ